MATSVPVNIERRGAVFSNKKKVLIYFFALVFLTSGIVYVITAEKTMQRQRTELQDTQIGLEEIKQMAEEILDASENTVILTQEEWEIIQDEKSKLEAEIADLKFSLSNNEVAFSLYEDRIKYLTIQRSEENGSPITADASTPWEIDLAFRTAMNNGKYKEAWALLTAEIHEACTIEWFVEKTEQAEEPPQFSETIFVDEAEGKNGKFAAIYVEKTSIGHERLVYIMFPGNAGQWGVPLFSPTTCQ